MQNQRLWLTKRNSSIYQHHRYHCSLFCYYYLSMSSIDRNDCAREPQKILEASPSGALGGRKGHCTYGWKRWKILERPGIQIGDFSLRWRSFGHTVIRIRWSDTEQSTVSRSTLNAPRYPTSDFIPCASSDYGGCQPNPRSPSQPSLSTLPRSIRPSTRSVWWFDASFLHSADTFGLPLFVGIRTPTGFIKREDTPMAGQKSISQILMKTGQVG